MPPNQNPEQIARDAIEVQLQASGGAVQSKDAIDFHAGAGQAIREYSTDTGPADYVLFVAGQPVGVIESKKETLGQNITTVQRLKKQRVIKIDFNVPTLEHFEAPRAIRYP